MGLFTLRDLKIVDSGPFYEFDLFSLNIKSTFWHFFDSSEGRSKSEAGGGVKL
jgi:hypothetical protein